MGADRCLEFLARRLVRLAEPVMGDGGELVAHAADAMEVALGQRCRCHHPVEATDAVLSPDD
jgi:hypothetical protein